MSGAPGSGKGARQLPAGLRGDGAIVRKHTATKGFRADSSRKKKKIHLLGKKGLGGKPVAKREFDPKKAAVAVKASGRQVFTSVMKMAVGAGAAAAVAPGSGGSVVRRGMNMRKPADGVGVTSRGANAKAARGPPKKSERFKLYRAAHVPGVKTNVMV
eukprot:gene23295-30347_t